MNHQRNLPDTQICWNFFCIANRFLEVASFLRIFRITFLSCYDIFFSYLFTTVNNKIAFIRSSSECVIIVMCFFNRQQRRFLVIDEAQFILVEPDTTKLGWGVVKFVARLQVTGLSSLN